MSDLIERQVVLDAMYALCGTGETLKDNPWRDNPHIDAIADAINELPSAEHQETVTEFADRCRECGKRYTKRQTGHWISEKVDGEDWKGCKRQYYQPISCSKCHSPNHYKSTYCPNCGARMEGEDKK